MKEKKKIKTKKKIMKMIYRALRVFKFPNSVGIVPVSWLLANRLLLFYLRSWLF